MRYVFKFFYVILFFILLLFCCYCYCGIDCIILDIVLLLKMINCYNKDILNLNINIFILMK